MKKILKRTSVFLGGIFTILLLYGVLFLFNFFQGWTTVKADNVSSYVTPLKEFKSNYTPKKTFENQPISKVLDVQILYQNKEVEFSNILLKSQRYYLPLEEVCSTFGFVSTTDSLITKLSGPSSISIDKTTAIIDGESYKLRGELITQDEVKYICLSDIEKIFNLIAEFDFENKIIKLIDHKKTTSIRSLNNQEGKAVLIRLEDFSPGTSFIKSENQLKFKAMGDLMQINNIKFHVAWIARYISPENNIDNDLLSNQGIENVGFINLLDYLINSGGLIGSHGYTHQHGDETSGIGSELTRSVNSTESETREVVENALDTASALNIPVGFFESPHYHATSSEKKIIEEYYQYIYEPRSIFIYHSLYSTKKGNLYIPTPLSYVRDLNVKPIINNLNNPRFGLLASMFYHPTKELDFIHTDTSNITFTVDYSVDSPLQQIIKAINENGYTSIHVNQFK